MEMYQLKHLVAVLKHKSISDAAVALHVSQPAVTRSLHKLGEEIGAPLYRRVSGGVVPSQIGELLGEHAKAILGQHERAKRDISDSLGGKTSQVAIGINDGLIEDLTPAIVKQTRATRPDIHLTIVHEGFESIARKVATGAFDFGVTIERSLDSRQDSLTFESLFEDREYLYANANHPISSRKKVPIEDTGALEWAVLGTNHSRAGFFDAYFTLKGIQRPQVVLETSSLLVLRETVRFTDSVGILPNFLLKDSAKSLGLVRLNVEEFDLKMRVGLILDPSRPLSESRAAMIQIIKDQFASHHA